MCFDVENECTRKKFQECNIRNFLDQEHNLGIFFGECFGCQPI